MSRSQKMSCEGYVLTPSGWVRGHIVVEGDRIAGVEGEPVRTPDVAELPYLIPGFIDLHVHGGDGVDYSEGEDQIRRFIRFHARRGTVALAPTTSTSPSDAIEQALRDIETVRCSPRPDEPTVLGAHLEGPFISPGKLGAQRNLTLEGDAALALRWSELCHIVVATVAPEICGGIDVIKALAGQGCRVQVGHSLATAEQTAAGFACGLSGFTHLFNGMSGLDHRHPGVAAYALAQGRYAELICDLNHAHASMVLAAYRAIPQLYAISDATKAAGCPDGVYVSGGDHVVVKKGITIMLANGRSLAGSAITMLDGFRNLMSLGLSVAEASQLCSNRPAEYLGLRHLGRIAPGSLASFLVLNRNLELQSVWLRGWQSSSWT
jgi:N-acetylglucosamine-6-phosphate deacetylase